MQLNYTDVMYEGADFVASDTPRIRGYFGRKYFDEIDMHNHNHVTNNVNYQYPKVQYKVIDGKLHLIGLCECAETIINVGVSESTISIGDQIVDLGKVIIKSECAPFGVSDVVKQYEFVTPWLSLNETNVKRFVMSDAMDRDELLERILVGNILSMSKTMNYRVEDTIKVRIKVHSIDASLKSHDMIGFMGRFKTNFELPDYIGLGKSPSRGFGTVRAIA